MNTDNTQREIRLNPKSKINEAVVLSIKLDFLLNYIRRVMALLRHIFI